MTPPPLRVIFLWHFHQPWYADLGGGAARLPWVRLHALKDYADLPALLSHEPRVPHAANLVPSLLDQIELLASGALTDSFLEVSRAPVADWDMTTVGYVLNNFFSVHPRRMETYPHYMELVRRARQVSDRPSGSRRAFSREDLRDLVVLFHLAWSGETLLKDPLLVKLKKRGHRFGEDEKNALLDRQAEFLKEVLPAWRRAFDSGVVEATTSPYHHPILPLLVDSGAGREAIRELPLPAIRFAHPEDARQQIALGQAAFERHFGFVPKGMWPPEGALSEPALTLMAEAGVAWVASDEDVLLNSLKAAKEFGEGDRARAIFQPWKLASGASPAIFFRDRVLSDRIGFSYATWSAADAASDFVTRLLAIREAAPEADLVIPVVLDGENAWESYPENGSLFMRALAAALAREDRIRVVTPSQALAASEPALLPRLIAGSWVGGNLATWIGAPAKNRAWDLLTKARETLGPQIASAKALRPAEVLAAGAAGPEAAKAALFAAEASDWFWWFGDDHTSAHDAVFDALFRKHLETAYSALGHDVPSELEHPVEPPKTAAAVMTTTPISPTIDGRPPDYFEWLGAGRVSARARGTMERGIALIRDVFFGAGAADGSFFLRVDPAAPPASESLAGRTLRVLVISGADGGEPHRYDVPLLPGVGERDGYRIGVERIVEVALPRPETADGVLSFRVVLLDEAGHELESVPADDWVRFRIVTEDWSA